MTTKAQTNVETKEPASEAEAVEPVDNEVAEAGLSIEDLQRELEAAQAKADENWDKVLRAQADIENLRKRGARDLENAHKYAVEKLAGELLAVRDSLELGLDVSGDNIDPEKLREGTELTLKMLVQAMDKFNIEQVDPMGQPFDPERHQAMTMQENAELAPNTVLTVVQKGYVLNDRLLRPAMVIVSKAPQEGA